MSVWFFFYVRGKLENLLTVSQQILTGKFGRTTEIFLDWFKNSKFSEITFSEKVYFSGKAGCLMFMFLFLCHCKSDFKC